MTVRVIRLGSPRLPDEGVRIGTVRRPPRGVAKSRFAADDWYDVWFPLLAPNAETVKLAQQAGNPADWAAFERKYRAEMAKPEPSLALDLLAALSQASDFSVGCYCEDEQHCHRSVLRELLAAKGARLG